MKYNEENGITPETIKKDVREILEISSEDNVQEKIAKKRFSANEKNQLIEKLTKEMRAAAKLLEFEHAAYLRDQIEKIKNS
jgi:excinuclease ABC subunit B